MLPQDDDGGTVVLLYYSSSRRRERERGKKKKNALLQHTNNQEGEKGVAHGTNCPPSLSFPCRRGRRPAAAAALL